MKVQITPFLWYRENAGEAARFYISILGRSSKTRIISESDQSVNFKIQGQEVIAFNGGPYFKFTEAFSFFVNCKTQKEVDFLWNKLSAGGSKGNCGWLKDKYGVSWQIIPEILLPLLGDDDSIKAERTMKAMLKMKKLDIQKLKKAHQGR
jgi:predicted 3-demethylubiquinone-9 3-methyltransferase (glyoxalase superfamily)